MEAIFAGGFCSGPTMIIRAPPTRSSSAYLADEGVTPEDITTIYTPFGAFRLARDRREDQGFRLGRKTKTAVISTINGDANRPSVPRIDRPTVERRTPCR